MIGRPMNGRTGSVLVLVVSMAFMALLGGCATPPPADDPEALAFYNEVNDPLEPLNRAVFDFNITLDRYTLKPVSYAYKEAVPGAVQYIIRNFLDHLKLPVVFVNDLLQGEITRANHTFWRATINTFIGFGGVGDPATEFGFPPHNEGFGQTLAVWGLGSGPYLMLPLLGPSNPRDAFGQGVDSFTNPLTYMDIPIETRGGLFGADKLTLRAKHYDVINTLERTSLDYYAAVRSLYWQRLKDEINNGRRPKNEKQRPLFPEESTTDDARPARKEGN